MVLLPIDYHFHFLFFSLNKLIRCNLQKHKKKNIIPLKKIFSYVNIVVKLVSVPTAEKVTEIEPVSANSASKTPAYNQQVEKITVPDATKAKQGKMFFSKLDF